MRRRQTGSVPGAGQGAEPIGPPFPDIARHIVEAKAVGRIAVGGGGADMAIFGGVVLRELALPDVVSMLSLWDGVVAPREFHVAQATPCGQFPLRLRREGRAGKAGKGHGIVP